MRLTRRGQFVVGVLVALGFVGASGLAGWIEGWG